MPSQGSNNEKNMRHEVRKEGDQFKVVRDQAGDGATRKGASRSGSWTTYRDHRETTTYFRVCQGRKDKGFIGCFPPVLCL